MSPTKIAAVIVAGLALVVLALLPRYADAYYLSLAISLLQFTVLATAWGLFSGPTRYVSLATTAFFGVGAYTVAVLGEVLAWPLVLLIATAIGALTAPKISMQPGLSSDVIILSFAIVVIGGLGSVEGAAVGAILVGLARAASVHLMPQAELFMIYLIMAGVLMFRPEGLFKRETARRI